MHRVFHDVEPKIITLTVRNARLDTAASHPDREASRMVVPPIGLLRESALAEDRAAELATQTTSVSSMVREGTREDAVLSWLEHLKIQVLQPAPALRKHT